MKRRYPLMLMFVFGLLAVWTSLQSYKIARREITNQLTEALLLTQADAPRDWLSTDTIRQFRSHIRQPELRASAGLALYAGDADDRSRGLQSRALSITSSVRARGYLAYSAWQVWWMSDQRLSALMALLMLVSMAASLRRFRMSPLSGDKQNNFRLTPMQEQLVGLLMAAPGHEMPKQALCQALWPGKPDASETLYTLVRRTKQALEGEDRMRIHSVRGGAYRLDIED